jgi:hypothetical protein
MMPVPPAAHEKQHQRNNEPLLWPSENKEMEKAFHRPA